MTPAIPRTSGLAAAFFGILAVLGFYVSNPMLLMAACILFATVCVFPSRNFLVFWPFALAFLMLLSYAAYALMWLFGEYGLSQKKSLTILTVELVVCALLLIRFRSSGSRSLVGIQRISSTLIISISIVCLLIFSYIAYRFVVDPTAVVADHLAGGDHGIHLEYVNGLIQGSQSNIYTSPLSLQAYPKGVHFIIALFYSSTSSVTVMDGFFDLHLFAAFFEYVQIAAFVTLFLNAVIGNPPSHQKTYWIPVYGVLALILLFSIPKLFSHLFWSGFTSSLALTWILLMPLALPAFTETDWEFIHPVMVSIMWGLLTILVWIVYQPYVIVTGSVLVGLAVGYLDLKLNFLLKKPLRVLSRFMPAIIAFLLPIFYLWLRGNNSESVRRLSLFGVSWRIDQTLLLLILAFASAVILWTAVKTNLSHSDYVQIQFILALVTFTFAIALVVVLTSQFTFFDQPYYTQKMYWVLAIIMLTIGLSWTRRLIASFEGTQSSLFLIRMIKVVSILSLLIPVAVFFRVEDLSERISISWFSRGMQTDVNDIDPFNAAAFNTWENLGAHVGNIALREVSDSYLPVDIAQSRNSYWACWYMRQKNVNVVYTATGQGAALLDAGCSQFITYIESGVRLDNLVPRSPRMRVNRVLSAAAGGSGRKYFVLGFAEASKVGRWGHGFHSTIQMVSSVSSENSFVTINFIEHRQRQLPLEAKIYVNGVHVITEALSRESLNAKLKLPSIERGSLVSIQLNCVREEQQVLQASKDLDSLKCFQVKDLMIGNYPGD